MINLSKFDEIHIISKGYDAKFFKQCNYGYLVIDNIRLETIIIKLLSLLSLNEYYGDYLHKIIISNEKTYFQVSLLEAVWRDKHCPYSLHELFFVDQNHISILTKICSRYRVWFGEDDLDVHDGNVGIFKNEWVLFDPLYFAIVENTDFALFLKIVSDYNIPVMIA